MEQKTGMRTRVGAHALVAVVALGLVVALGAVAGHAEDDPALGPKIEKLIADLGADDFRTREKASEGLAALGEAARAGLTKAAKESESLEARWRAQQLLHRLDGSTATPLDAPDEDDLRRADPRSMEDLVEFLKRLEKKFDRDLVPTERAWGGRWPFTAGATSRSAKAPGLELRPGRDGVSLHVTKKNEAGEETTTVYEGRDLEAILQQHPELAEHPGMAQLKKRLLDPFAFLRDAMKMPSELELDFEWPRMSGTITSSQGVEIRQDARGVRVRIREKNDAGEDVVKEYEGKSLEQIKKEHPELAEKLGDAGMRFRFHVGPTQIFRDRGAQRWLEPFRAPAGPVRPQGTTFGVVVQTPEEALTVHLRLGAGNGALVREVMPGSQAQAMGVERNDILVRINGTQVTSIDQAQRLLREVARDKASLSLEIVRTGKRMELTR